MPDEQKKDDSLTKKIKSLQKKESEKMQESYQKEIEELKKAKEEALGKAMRAMAELQNAQKRMEQEKVSFVAFAAQGLVMRILEIYENYHRLLEHEPGFINEERKKGKKEDPLTQWMTGFELIEQQFQSLMQRQGVSITEVMPGEKINPEKHEAVMTAEGEEGVILEVLAPGYEMRGRVIKTTKVKVGKGIKPPFKEDRPADPAIAG